MPKTPKTSAQRTTVRVDRLRKLADFLDTLPREKFDFHIVCRRDKPSCGTVGCAMGWTPKVFPRLIKWVPLEWRDDMYGVRPRKEKIPTIGRTQSTYSAGASHLFNMGEGDAEALFGFWEPSPADGTELPPDATPKQVARRIRTYANWCERTGKQYDTEKIYHV